MLHAFPNVLLGNRSAIATLRMSRNRFGSRPDGVPLWSITSTFCGTLRSGPKARPWGAVNRGFDNTHVKDQTPIPALGTVSDEQAWERLRYFLKAIVQSPRKRT